ncbi:MAG: CotH kinase family protein [Chitinispirillaceae bacterium]|nr:CotH kinase family protein [Chitinispirillaceae bacterium]
MFKSNKIAFFLIIAAGYSFCQVQDSSQLIFNDTIVNRYRINFYIPNWRDSLIYWKSNGEEYIPAKFTWYSPSGDSIVLDSIGVRYKGNSSYAVGSEKKPFKFSFDKYRKKQRFFSIEKLNFSNIIEDPSMMREKIAYDILKKYMPSPRSAFAVLTIEDSLVNCLYTQVEQVDKIFLTRHYTNDKDNLYKAADQGASLDYLSANKDDYKEYYELKTNEKKDDWTGLINLLEKLKNTPDADFVNVVGGILDLDNCIRYLAFNMVNGNFDSYTGSGRNFYIYEDKTYGKFRWIPWDLNLSFGAYTYSWQSEITTLNPFTPNNLDQRLLAMRILGIDSLKKVYVQYMRNMIEGPLSADSVAVLGHKYASVIGPHVQADTKKFYTYEQFQRNIDSNVVIQAGTKKIILLGLKWYTAERNKNVLTHIENLSPVIDKSRNCRINGSSITIPGRISGRNLSINYTLESNVSAASITMFNAKGEKLHKLNEGPKERGAHTANLNIHSMPSGYYLLVLDAENISLSNRVLILQ